MDDNGTLPVDTDPSEDHNCSGVDVTLSPCLSETEWYNSTSCLCQTFPLDTLELLDPAGLVFLSVAIFSTLLDIFVVIVFIRSRYTPIVKAANRELSFLLLVVLLISFSFPFIHIGPVEPWRCQARVWLEGPVSTCMYSIFLVKTHRVLSIFEARLPKVVHRHWILGSNLQLVGVFLLTLLQVIIVAVFVNIFSPSVEYISNPDFMETYAQCRSDATADIIFSAYPILITILCFCFAFRARRLPENYGESRHIMANMAVNLTVYFTCFGLEHAYQGKTKTIVANVFLSVSPLGGLVLLFVPKVYIILICPERNTVQELRRMTLAHMQRQSEFSPDTDAAVREERKKQGEDTRSKSLRRSKQNGVSTKGHSNKHLPNEQSRPVANGSKKSTHSVDNGNTNSKKENGDAIYDPTDGEGDQPDFRTFSKVPAVDNVTKNDSRNVDLPQRMGPRHGMQKRSNSLFVIQLLDEIVETENEGSVIRTVAGDHPLSFSLRETDNEGGLEGDMFVVSMLGRTLTLKVDDRDAVGVPQALGGVYVGCKTNGTSGIRETADGDPNASGGKQSPTVATAKEQSEFCLHQDGHDGKTCSDAQCVNSKMLDISAPGVKKVLGVAVSGLVDVFQGSNDVNRNQSLSTADTFETSNSIGSPNSDNTGNGGIDTNGKHTALNLDTIHHSSKPNQKPQVPAGEGEKNLNAVPGDVWFEGSTTSSTKIPQINPSSQVGEDDTSSESPPRILEMTDIQMEFINPCGIQATQEVAENTKTQPSIFVSEVDTEF